VCPLSPCPFLHTSSCVLYSRVRVCPLYLLSSISVRPCVSITLVLVLLHASHFFLFTYSICKSSLPIPFCHLFLTLCVLCPCVLCTVPLFHLHLPQSQYHLCLSLCPLNLSLCPLYLSLYHLYLSSGSHFIYNLSLRVLLAFPGVLCTCARRLRITYVIYMYCTIPVSMASILVPVSLNT